MGKDASASKPSIPTGRTLKIGSVDGNCKWRQATRETTKGRPEGQYRTNPEGDREPMAYVIDRGAATFVAEATYRAKGCFPAFDELPTEDQYHA
jgi:hypothetical protein